MECMTMNVFDSVRTVLAVREYQDRPIPDDALGRIVEAGRLSASARNRQPWHFIVVNDPATLDALAAVATSGRYISGAQAAIVVAIDPTTWAESDASRAIQNMILTAWDEGIGSNWVGFYGLEGANAVLGIPADLKVLAIVPLGYPVASIGKGDKKRKPLGEVASRNRFGQPFS
jgi:nitroreductase